MKITRKGIRIVTLLCFILSIGCYCVSLMVYTFNPLHNAYWESTQGLGRDSWIIISAVREVRALGIVAFVSSVILFVTGFLVNKKDGKTFISKKQKQFLKELEEVKEYCKVKNDEGEKK